MKVELIPILKDNYVFIITDSNSSEAIVVDPGESDPVLKFLEENNLHLSTILLTHHHHDHIGGVSKLKNHFNSKVFAPLKNKDLISAEIYLHGLEIISILDTEVTVFDLPGHTLGHISYYFKKQGWLFSGDVLFGLGCGRLFEGSPQQGYESLQKIKNLPDKTLIYCTHEYTELNLGFCNSLEKFCTAELKSYEKSLLKKRKQNLPSVPLILDDEKNANPFLIASNVQEFTYLRDKRNTW